MVNVTYTQSVVIENGPTMSETVALAADGYDKLTVVVPSSGIAVAHVQSSPNAKVQMIFIRSSLYTIHLRYQPNGAPDSIELTGPVMIVGGGIMDIATDWKTITFDNFFTAPITVEILVVRNPLDSII
jgi:hypothetical protein